MTVINAPMEGTVHNNMILLLVPLVTQVNTCQVVSPAIIRSESKCKICQRSKYTNQMAGQLYSGVVRENTSLTMRVPKVNIIVLMTVINAGNG